MGNFMELLKEKSDDFNYTSRGHEPILITPDGAFVYKAQCFELCSSQRCARYDEGGMK